MDYNVELYLKLGGRPGLRPVIELFYERLAADPWLGQWFADVDLLAQARKLEDFLSVGVPDEPAFDGHYPALAHAHMYITQPMIKRRIAILSEAIADSGHPPEIVRLWLKADALWHGTVVKRDLGECSSKVLGKPVKVIEDPADEAPPEADESR